MIEGEVDEEIFLFQDSRSNQQRPYTGEPELMENAEELEAWEPLLDKANNQIRSNTNKLSKSSSTLRKFIDEKNDHHDHHKHEGQVTPQFCECMLNQEKREIQWPLSSPL